MSNILHNIRHKLIHVLEHNDTSSNRRTLSEDDIDDFGYAADHREDPLWAEFTAILSELEKKRPIRVAKLRQDIRWMRRQAKKKGLRWGK